MGVTGQRGWALVVAAGYLAAAWACVLYAWLDPGVYSLNYLFPALATFPASLLMLWVGPTNTAGLAVGLMACAVAQAGVLYLLGARGWREQGPAA
jgi:hypothetical protein